MAHEITNEQIEALRVEAALSGDMDQADLCTAALGGDAAARAACARAIDDARAMQISTAFGTRSVVRRFGNIGEYVYTAPTPSAPNGEYWLQTLAGAWVPVASNGRAIRAAMAMYNTTA